MAATMSPSTSHAERKSFTITSILLLPARGTLGSASTDGFSSAGARCRLTPKKLRHQFWRPAQRLL